MTGAKSVILWIISILGFVYFVIPKHEQDHETDKEKLRGDCCG
jgi:hypothetical protein